MSILKEFEDLVEKKDKISIKIMLKNSMLIDPTLKQFNEMLNYASDKIELFDIHDGKELINNESKWDRKYLSQEMVRVVKNFSEKRIELLKIMIQHLYKSI